MAKNSKEKQRQYDAKRAGRTRNFTAILYPEDLPENWRAMIDDSHVRWIESPLHDKDVNPDGTPKKAHYHVMLIFESVKTLAQVVAFFKELFGSSDKGSIIGVAAPQVVSDRCALIRYFAHLDHPSKAQYDVTEIIGHGIDVAEIMRYSQRETIAMMIDIEKFIESHKIVELCDLSAAIRESNPEWYVLVTTRNTVYFNAFIRSYRHKLQAMNEQQAKDAEELSAVVRDLASGVLRVDENGELVEGVPVTASHLPSDGVFVDGGINASSGCGSLSGAVQPSSEEVSCADE